MNKIKQLAAFKRSSPQELQVDHVFVEPMNGTPQLPTMLQLPRPCILKCKEEELMLNRKIQKNLLEYLPFSMRRQVIKAKAGEKVFTGQDVLDILDFAKDIVLDEVDTYYGNIMSEKLAIQRQQLEKENKDRILMLRRDLEGPKDLIYLK